MKPQDIQAIAQAVKTALIEVNRDLVQNLHSPSVQEELQDSHDRLVLENKRLRQELEDYSTLDPAKNTLNLPENTGPDPFEALAYQQRGGFL